MGFIYVLYHVRERMWPVLLKIKTIIKLWQKVCICMFIVCGN